MAAGVYGSSEGLSVLTIERCAAGGQAGTSSRIENYLGFPEGISGDDLTGRGFKQATRFGAEVALTRSVEKLTPSSEGYLCEIDGGQTVLARAVVLAIGVDWRRLQARVKIDCLDVAYFMERPGRRRPMWSARRSSSWEAEIQRGKLPCFYRAMRLK